MAVAAFLISGMSASSAMAIPASGTGNSIATVLVPISVDQNITDLDFGSFDGTATGFVTVTPLGAIGAGSIPQNPAASHSAGSVTINGATGLSFTASVTGPATLDEDGPGTATMGVVYTIETGTGTPSTTPSTALVAGGNTLGIGGTATITSAPQVPGTYSGTFTVTANY